MAEWIRERVELAQFPVEVDTVDPTFGVATALLHPLIHRKSAVAELLQ